MANGFETVQSSNFTNTECHDFGFNLINNQNHGWCAGSSNLGEWFQINAPNAVSWTKITTKGRDADYILTYGLDYSIDGSTWLNYNSGEVLSGNSDATTAKSNDLLPHFQARKIRLLPLTWLGHPSMRIEAYYSLYTESYLDGSTCLCIYIYNIIYIYIACDNSCNKCNWDGAENCTTCFQSISYHCPIYTTYGTCVADCETNCLLDTKQTFLNTGTEICNKCHVDCDLCEYPGDQNSCINCSDNLKYLCQDVSPGIGNCQSDCTTCLIDGENTYMNSSSSLICSSKYMHIYIYI